MIGATLPERARRYAALSGAFDPVDALHALGDPDPDDARTAVVELAAVCETSQPTGWLMWGWARRRELDALADDGDLDAAVDAQRRVAREGPDADLLEALTGTGRASPAAVREAAGAPEPDRDELVRLAMALDRAGSHAPAFAELTAVRTAIAALDAAARVDWVDDRGVFGREAELAQALQWVQAARDEVPVRAFAVTGPAGIGKTTLLDEVARRATRETQALVVRLDFERAGLDVLDRVGLVGDIARQIARQRGEAGAALEAERLEAVGADRAHGLRAGEGRDRLPLSLARATGDAVRAAGTGVLVTLDALETLPRRGETHTRRLFETLDALCAEGVGPLAVVAAGSAEAFERVADRVGSTVVLGGLDDESAGALLASLEVPLAQRPAVLRAAAGSPTILRLGATAVREFGRDAVAGVAERGAASLFHFLLGRIGDDTRRALAQPGLLARRISPELLADVLGAQLELADASAAAHDAFSALAVQEWLVEPDVVDGWLRLRPGVRAMLLEDVYRDLDPAQAGRLNRAIADWYGVRDEPFAALEAAYHRLQAMRAGAPAPHLSPAVLSRIDEAMLSELDKRAQDAVRAARGDRTSRYRHTQPLRTAADARAAAGELEAALERGDLIEAAHIHRRSFAPGGMELPPAAAAVARAFEWRVGRWGAALAGSRPDLVLAERPGSRAPVVERAHLEMWAETRFAGLVHALQTQPGFAEHVARISDRMTPHALTGGAVELARLRAGRRSQGAPGDRDAVDAAVEIWSDSSAAHAEDLTVRAGDALAGRSIPSAGDAGREAVARALAAASPYALVADAVLQQAPHDDALPQHLWGVAGALGATGILASSATHGQVLDALDAVTDAGLFAEWISAASSTLRRPDLRPLARAAERWRRTMAGDWGYTADGTDILGGWAQRPDPVILARAKALHTLEDCLDDIAVWAGGADPQRTLEVLRRRHRTALEDIAQRALPDAITVLQDHSVRVAFVPALAALHHREGMPS